MSSLPPGRVLGAQQAGHALALAVSPEPLQPLDENRIVGGGRRILQQFVQQLVVAGGGHVEPLANGLFFDSGMFPPRPLEIEDVDVSFA